MNYRSKPVLDRLYDVFIEDEDTRLCKDISDESCKEVPRNFFAITAANSLTSLGDALANPKTVIAWLMNQVGAPVYLIGFLVPIRESGSMLPQLFIAGWIRTFSRRKWVWIIGCLLQFAALAGMAAAAWTMAGAAAGWTIIALLTVFSLARSLCSISYKDIVGKTVPKTRRGRLSGLNANISGLLTVCTGVYLLVFAGQGGSGDPSYALVAIASGLWLAAALLFSLVGEPAGATEGGDSFFRGAAQRLAWLKKDPSLTLFIAVRTLMLTSALSAPYYVVLAQNRYGDSPSLLGAMILAHGLASAVSALVWGRWSDVSSRKVICAGGALTGALGVFSYVLLNASESAAAMFWVYPALYFVLGVAYNGVRIGRKTFIVDMAGNDRRADYVAVSNTLIGILLLLSSGLGFLTQAVSPLGMILIMGCIAFAGSLLGLWLPEVEE